MSENSEVNKRYINNDLQGLVDLLEEQLMVSFEDGNDILAAKTLAHLGIVQLFLSNHYATAVIFNQILDEYRRDEPDPRKAAVYSRFLGLYEAFYGNKDAAQIYYRESLLHFEQLDWHTTESFMLVEAIYFYCLPYQDRHLLFQYIERLQRLQQKDDFAEKDWVKRELMLLENGLQFLKQPYEKQELMEHLTNSNQEFPWFGSYYFWITIIFVFDHLSETYQPFELTEIPNGSVLPLHQFSVHLSEIHIYYPAKLYPKLSDSTERLKAKAAAFKHPWYCLVGNFIALICNQEKIERMTNLEQSPYYHLFSENSIIELWKQYVMVNKDHDQAPSVQSKGFIIHLFGNHSLFLKGKRLNFIDWKSPHLREFFLYLVMHPQGRISKEIVIEELFSNEDLKKSINRLYVTIHRVNRFLQDHFKIQEPFIQIQQGFVYFNQDLVDEVDIHVYRKLASVADQLWIDDKDAAIELMQKASKIYQYDLLSDFLYFDWLEEYRKSLQQTHGKLLRRLKSYYLSMGNRRDYEETSQQLIHLFPFEESIYHDYIIYLLAENRQLEAQYWYNQLKILLEKELGLAPSFDLRSS